ncbi:MAG TPA: DUF1801 domain-containing protein [Clostridia bacterium]|nr:DUF1801 domain-containing protein [Clostridia bacterium]HPQ46684.1 DUF1801 domain-containing protein [Clostridia bacterium]HRX42512.1 DUF1801 domain-containing protein [Clostridia bacterium]
MKVEADSIDELIRGAGEKEDLFRKLDELISNTVPGMERSFYKGSSINMIAYGMMPYKTTKSEYMWPVIGLAPQKDSINVYVSGVTWGLPIGEYYKDKLGKVSAGKSCIRIKSFDKLNTGEFKNLLIDAERWFRENPKGNTV